jgi:CRISPR-associated protein Cas1
VENSAAAIPEITPSDGQDWAERCQYWLNAPVQRKSRGGPQRRRSHVPLVLTGHGMRLNVDNGALVVRGGFTHYPQPAQEWRFFPADPQLPSRIVLLDGSGSLSLDVLDWLTAQKLPLVRIDWQGRVQAVLGGLATDPRKVAAQLQAQRNGRALAIAIGLIREKIQNSIATLQASLPDSTALMAAIGRLREHRATLDKNCPSSVREIIGIEGYAAGTYFQAWSSLPLKWKGIGRHPIPSHWHQIGSRSSVTRQKAANRHASHPVNAILNYAYAVLESQVRIQVVSEGYDPTIGYLHAYEPDRPALVLDLMEPLRPVVDRKVLEFVQSHTFHPADFTIRADGVCRLNPELIRTVVRILGRDPVRWSSPPTAGFVRSRDHV